MSMKACGKLWLEMPWVMPKAMPWATHQVLTEVDLSPPGDAFYPEYAVDEWVEVRREVGEGCQWTWLERMDPAA